MSDVYDIPDLMAFGAKVVRDFFSLHCWVETSNDHSVSPLFLGLVCMENNLLFPKMTYQLSVGI
jgi:hypothetical protein